MVGGKEGENEQLEGGFFKKKKTFYINAFRKWEHFLPIFSVTQGTLVAIETRTDGNLAQSWFGRNWYTCSDLVLFLGGCGSQASGMDEQFGKEHAHPAQGKGFQLQRPRGNREETASGNHGQVLSGKENCWVCPEYLMVVVLSDRSSSASWCSISTRLTKASQHIRLSQVCVSTCLSGF